MEMNIPNPLEALVGRKEPQELQGHIEWMNLWNKWPVLFNKYYHNTNRTGRNRAGSSSLFMAKGHASDHSQ